MAKRKLNLQIPEVYQPLFQSPKRKNVLYGGRGSAKSHTVARYIIMRAMAKKELVLCTRELQKSISESVHALLKKCIEEMGLLDFFTVQNATIIGRNGSRFIFAGVRTNTNEIKSMEGVTICWVEEAQAMTQQSLDVLIPTIRAPGSILIFTFNPFKDSDPVYTMANNPDEDTLVIHANYDDNPFFPEELRKEMEACKRTDYDKYLWVWEGQCLGISAAQIFRGKYEVKEFESPPNAIFRYGADWGFANDPTACIRSFIIGNTLYCDYEAAEVGVDLDDIPLRIFDPVPGTRLHPIWADNSRPETISKMNKKGYNVLAAEKWSGSIEDGIAYLRSFDKIVVHPRCKQLIEEFDLYQYKVDTQTNEILREPVDKYNHLIDALRYSHTTSMRADSNGKVYACFNIDNVCLPILPMGVVYVATLAYPGRTLCVALQLRGGNIVVVEDFEIRGTINFATIRSKFAPGVELLWFPFAKSDDVSAELIQDCIANNIEPSVGLFFPDEVESAYTMNALFQSKQLTVCNNCELTITSLTERVFMSAGDLEKNSQQNKVTKFCRLLEYAVYRTQGRAEE